jgi:hypothetical protein
VALVVDDRVLHVGVLIVALGQEHGCAEIYRMPPPPGEDAALDPEAADVAGVRRDDDGWDDLVGCQSDRSRVVRVERDADRIAVEVAG